MIQINTEKSVVFLYTNNKLSEKGIKRSTTFTRASKTKYSGINLIMEVKDLYSENYKTLIKEIEEEANKWKGISCSCIRRVLLNCQYYKNHL